MNNFYSRKYLRKGIKMVRCDLTASASRFIVFEDFDESTSPGELGSINSSPRRAFESVFLQYLTRKLPSIAVQAFGIGEGAPFLVDLLSRNIPVLLLDATERAISVKRPLPSGCCITTLAKETNAFPSIPVDAVRRLKRESGQLTLQSRLEILCWAERMIEKKWKVLAKHGTTDCLNASLLAFAHSVLNLGAASGSSSSMSCTGQIVPLHVRIRELEKFERTNKDTTYAAIPTELLSRMMDFLYNQNLVLSKAAQLAKVEKWIAQYDKELEHLMSQATTYQRELKAECTKIAENNGQLCESEKLVREVWLAEYDILSSGNTFSGSLFDLDGIKQILASVAKIDRLPSSNSLSALRSIQDAWDYVEIYHAVADGYKHVTKISYVILLLIGILVTVLAVTGAEFSDKFSARIPIICLSFLGTVIGSFVSFRNPALKWQQLRIAALALESETWMFRTRAGHYRSNGESFDDSAERRLCIAVDEIKSAVLEGADVKNTPFYSRSISRNLHGQHVKSAGGFGMFDSYADAMDSTVIYTANGSGDKNGSGMNSASSVESGDCSSDRDDLRPSHSRQQFKRKRTNSLFTQLQHGLTNRVAIDSSCLSLDAAEAGLGCSSRIDPSFSRLLRMGSVPLMDIIQSLTPSLDGETEHPADSHYEPVQPDQYIRFRVQTALQFYKARIPVCNRTRTYSQLLLVLGSIAAGVLAFANVTAYAGIVSIVSGAITAYLEFSGTNSKISRYSFTVHALQKLILWWQTLPSIDKSVVANIDYLVVTCEELLQVSTEAYFHYLFLYRTAST